VALTRDLPRSTSAESAGTADIEVSVDRLDDDSGTALVANTELGVVIVGPPPVTGSAEPTDPDGDGRFEDVNGNGRVDYDDIQLLFDNFDDDSVALNKTAYDFNENGKLEYDDIVTLYSEVN